MILFGTSPADRARRSVIDRDYDAFLHRCQLWLEEPRVTTDDRCAEIASDNQCALISHRLDHLRRTARQTVQIDHHIDPSAPSLGEQVWREADFDVIRGQAEPFDRRDALLQISFHLS